jgi:Sec-independent protein translocase protein TatA
VDTICGVGLPELVILALLGFVVIGPERSREVALSAGRFLRKVMTSSWWDDFSSITKSLRDLPNTLVRMAEIEEAQADLQRTMQDIEDLTKTEITLGQGKPSPTRQRDEGITDPWGIRNAAAGTTITPPTAAPDPEPEPVESEEPPETSQEDDEQPAG